MPFLDDKTNTMDNSIISRITLNQDVCKGKPTIRNMRFTVTQMLELVALGMTFEEILEDYSFIERDDILACINHLNVN